MRIVLGALIIAALAIPATMDTARDRPPAMQLVDESRDDYFSPSPGTPSPSPSTPDQSPSPSPGDTEPGEAPGDEKTDNATGLAAMPIAAQAGLSLGVILLAAIALLPGRRPPAHLRA
ncbi:hypothetical protein ACFQ3B_04590 [Stackebrandtia endophytica]